MTTALSPQSQPATTPALEAIPIPASHRDLLTRPIVGVLTTMGADGWPQSSLVWVDVDGEVAQVNTTLERQKGRNLLGRPEGQPAHRRSGRYRPISTDPRRG